jgi:Zn-dependent protease with chaperone function
VIEWLKAALLSGGGWPLALLLAANAGICSVTSLILGAEICLRPVWNLKAGNWAERARLVYPVWITLAAGVPLLVILSLTQAEALGRRMSFVGAKWVPWFCMAISLVAVGIVSAKIEARLKERRVTLGDWFRSFIIPWLLLFPHYPVFLVLATSLPDQFVLRVWLYVLWGSVAIGFYLLGGGLFVLRLAGWARRAPERLERIMEVAVKRVGIRPKVTYVIKWKAANALAFPLTKRIAVSDAALEHMDDKELIAICVHELGHLNESRRIKGLRVLGAFIWLPLICAKPIAATYGFAGVATTILLVFLGHHAVRRLTRAMEERADAISQAFEGEPGTYARALEHLYRLNLMPAVMRQKRATHPHLYDRLLAAQIVPQYPRPRPPSLLRPWGALLAMLVCALVYTVVWGAVLELILK